MPGTFDWSTLMNMGVGSITAEKVLQALLALVICLIIIKILLRIFDQTIDKMKIEKSLHTFIRSVFKAALIFFAVIIAADILGIKVTSLVTLFGVVGLALSLAVQGTLSNIAGGIMILTSKPFVVGDYIDAASVSGTVKDIGMVYTTFITIDNKVIFVPNSDISSTNIVNYTAQSERRIDMLFDVSYDNAIDDVKYTLKQVIYSEPRILQEPASFVGVAEYKESSAAYIIKVWCKTDDYWPLYYKLLEEVKHAFDENGIKRTYDHLNVHVMNHKDELD